MLAAARSNVLAGQNSYYGNSASPANTETFVEALAFYAFGRTLGITFTVNAAAGEKIYFACPTRYGAATFTYGGFAGGFILRSNAISVTNALGFTENYQLYESVSAGLGSTTVTVS
jgi:hypothetical protein